MSDVQLKPFDFGPRTPISEHPVIIITMNNRLAGTLPFPAPVERLAALLGPTFTDDTDRVRWGTLALLVDSFGAWR